MLTCRQIENVLRYGEKLAARHESAAVLVSVGLIDFYKFVNKWANDSQSDEKDVDLLLRWFQTICNERAASQQLANAPADGPREQWGAFVDVWQFAATEKRNARNACLKLYAQRRREAMLSDDYPEAERY